MPAAGKWVHALSLLLLLSPLSITSAIPDLRQEKHHNGGDEYGRWRSSRSVIDVEGGPESVVWAVQLSDLHFSVFHPERAHDFKRLLGPALALIKPSLVLITGDLTDGKSKDLLTMKQNEKEWMEYQNAIADVIEKSRLDKKIFYDLRGNHDNFGVPESRGAYDFYDKYSVNTGAGRSGNVHSVTLKINGWKHLFVGFDSTKDTGLRGPTNLFGHPSDQLLAEIDLEFSQWAPDTREKPLTKISFGHFPLSFSAAADSGRSLKDIFLKHSLSAYLCGHLHSRFGKNLKRHHTLGHNFPSSGPFYQLNIHQGIMADNFDDGDCSNESGPVKEFWEWEVGDWRKQRNMRILAIDSGHVSFLDTDFSLGSKKAIIMPTFPLDSRFMQRMSFRHDYNCESLKFSSLETIRALVFSAMGIDSVSAKIYDSRPGDLTLVMDSPMRKQTGNATRGDLYMTPWNWRAFVDPSPDRYWLQIEAVDILGKSTFSELRPFSINGLTAKVDWKWKEFLVMGFQWCSIYYPILWVILPLIFSLLLIPQAFLILSKNLNTNGIVFLHSRGKDVGFVVIQLAWIIVEFSKLTVIWTGTLVYLLYLTFFPWFSGNVFTEAGHLGYMTINGWAVTNSTNKSNRGSELGVPDIMVIVFPHLCFVVLPALLIMSALAAEKAACRARYLSLSGKKQDDHYEDRNRNVNYGSHFRIDRFCGRRWMRNLILLACLAVLWKHWKQCRALVKAYEMNPLLHSPVFCFMLPLLLAYTVYTTAAIHKS